MNRITLYILLSVCLCLASFAVLAQTASVTAGCSELKVEFSAPQASSYYWVFDNGPAAISTLQNPEHSYIQPGQYVVELFDVQGGTQVGDDIIITVFPPIEIDITADVRSGCAPQTVNFTSNITIDPGIDIEDIVWTFGDGSSASGADVTYTYPDNGLYTVSVKVIADQSIKCDEPVIFEDFISLEGEQVTFNLNQSTSCDVPDDFVFTNTTDAEPGSTYFWDFGDGQTIEGEGPHTHTYDVAGIYFPVLTVTSPSGCESSLKRTVNLGAPIVMPTYPDTICFGAEVTLNQTTVASSFLWDFSGADIDTTVSPTFSDLKRPLVLFTQPGLQTFDLTVTAVDGCESTTTLDIFVFEPDASYTLGPEVTCGDPLLVEFTPLDPTHSIYGFSTDITEDTTIVEFNTPNGVVPYDVPDRDEYYVNAQDSINTRLIITTAQGCKDTSFLTYFIQRPEAFMLPDVIKGCVPFDVNFSDLSFSDFDITTRFWDYGDGQQAQFTTETETTHTYTTPGIHEARLTITDAEGCRDQSREVQIIAIDKDTIPAVGLGGECPPNLTYCVGDSITLRVNADQIFTNIHIENDEGRFDHCWREQETTHTYQYPGVYPLDFTVEFFTVYIDSFSTGCDITVQGSRSDIDFSIDCADPYTVELSGENSINATDYQWWTQGQLISTEQSLTHTFADTGRYVIYLDTQQDGVTCSHRDSAVVFIHEIIARLSVPSITCASNPTPLDASSSQHVHDACRAGYTWLFEEQRPREVDDAVTNHFLLPGRQEVILIVEDINGCKDTTSASTNALDLQADFTADTLVCLPTDASLTNLSVGDTTLVGWDWNFGGSTSTSQNPGHVFDTTDFNPSLLGDSISIELIVTDIIGCTDTAEFFIATYEIFSELFMDNGPIICENESITFDALDFNEAGSFLNYDWDFGANGSSTENSPEVIFENAGEQPVTLTYTEESSGCSKMIDTLITVLDTPVADFITDQDSVEFICFPEQIQFTNTSDIGDSGTYFWDFGNGAESNIENPRIPFDKGTWEVELIVFTPEGCTDTTSRSFTLVGPEGDFSVDKDEICPGEEVTFTLNNTIDVANFTWDFGDGTQIDDQPIVTHTYDPSVSVEEFIPRLILRSDEDGCELDLSLPIVVSSIEADIIPVVAECPGELAFTSGFSNPQDIEWNIDGQIITGTNTPTVTTTSTADSISVMLTIVDANGCRVEREGNFFNENMAGSTEILFPNVFSPNGDALNPVFNIVYDPVAVTSDVEVTEFKVYNRWGELLYDNQNPTLGWDGRYKGEIVPADVYAYFIEVNVGCTVRSKKGNVTVIK